MTDKPRCPICREPMEPGELDCGCIDDEGVFDRQCDPDLPGWRSSYYGGSDDNAT